MYRLNKQYLVFVFYVLGIATFPFYLLPSGMPQLSHIIMLLFVLLCSRYCKVAKSEDLVRQCLFAFLLYVALRQLVFVAQTGNAKWIEPVLYLLFNAALFRSIYGLVMHHKYEALRLTYYGITVAIVVALVGVYIEGVSILQSSKDNYRAIGTFNNPNQLGYFALCAAGIIATLYVVRYISIVAYMFFYSACVVLVTYSLSKAALVAIVLYSLVLVKMHNNRTTIIMLVFVLSASLYIGISGIDITVFEELKFYQRLRNIGEDQDDSIEGRGMGLLLNPDERIVLGYGEGYVNTTSYNKEIHSTYGNVLLSYGVIGFSLFLAFYIILLWKVKRRFGLLPALAFFLPTIIYGSTHNGMRFSIFWIYLAILAATTSTPSGVAARNNEALSYRCHLKAR